RLFDARDRPARQLRLGAVVAQHLGAPGALLGQADAQHDHRTQQRLRRIVVDLGGRARIDLACKSLTGLLDVLRTGVDAKECGTETEDGDEAVHDGLLRRSLAGEAIEPFEESCAKYTEVYRPLQRMRGDRLDSLRSVDLI